MKDKLIYIYKYISQVLIVFAVTVLFITIIGIFFGEDVKEYSTMYGLGNEGISFNTILQVLLSSIVVSLINRIFFSEKFFANMMTLWKTILMITCILATIVIFVICFEWFPINMPEAWIGFFVSFGGFFLVSTAIAVTKTSIEAKKYDELLENYKKRHKEEENNKNESN